MKTLHIVVLVVAAFFLLKKAQASTSPTSAANALISKNWQKLTDTLGFVPTTFTYPKGNTVSVFDVPAGESGSLKNVLHTFINPDTGTPVSGPVGGGSIMMTGGRFN